MTIMMYLIILFCAVIVLGYIHFFGLYPILRFKSEFFGFNSFLKNAMEIKENIKLAIQKLPEKKDHKTNRMKFKKDYNKIDEEFSLEKYIFNHLWKEFTEQLIEPTGTNSEEVFQNSIRPESFFKLEYFCKEKKINLKLLESMPGILLGLGVLGTFLGLSLSLWGAFPHLTGDSPDVNKSINSLIEGAKLAFSTSVVGLFFSLVFNFSSDRIISMLQNSLNDFNSSLERSLEFVTEEHLLISSLEELKQHGKYLENMDERISLKVGDRIEQMGDKIQEAIFQGNQNISKNFLTNMANQITQGMGDFSKRQMEHLDQTLKALQENIPPLISRLENSHQESESQKKEFIEQLAEISQQSQNKINQSLVETAQSIKTEFESIIESLKQGMNQTLSHSSEELEKLITSLGEMNQKILNQMKSKTDSLNETIEKLHSFSNHVERTIYEINNTTTKNIKGILADFHSTIKQQKQIAEENKTYIHSLKNLTDSLKPIPFSLSEMSQKIPELIKQMDDSNKDLLHIWENYEKRFKNVDESAEQIFIKIKEGLGIIAKESTSYIENLNRQASQVSHSFSQAVEELKEAVEELNDYNKRENGK